MRKIKVWIHTYKVGSECSYEFEVDDDATEEEIQEMAYEAVWNMAEWNWEEL